MKAYKVFQIVDGRRFSWNPPYTLVWEFLYGEEIKDIVEYKEITEGKNLFCIKPEVSLEEIKHHFNGYCDIELWEVEILEASDDDIDDFDIGSHYKQISVLANKIKLVRFIDSW